MHRKSRYQLILKGKVVKAAIMDNCCVVCILCEDKVTRKIYLERGSPSYDVAVEAFFKDDVEVKVTTTIEITKW